MKIINAGATPNPCPTVALAPVPVYVTTENPAVVFALTDEVIDPEVLLTAVPPAFHCQETSVLPAELHTAVELMLKPVDVKEVGEPEVVASAEVRFELRPLVMPRTESCK